MPKQTNHVSRYFVLATVQLINEISHPCVSIYIFIDRLALVTDYTERTEEKFYILKIFQHFPRRCLALALSRARERPADVSSRVFKQSLTTALNFILSAFFNILFQGCKTTTDDRASRQDGHQNEITKKVSIKLFFPTQIVPQVSTRARLCARLCSHCDFTQTFLEFYGNTRGNCFLCLKQRFYSLYIYRTCAAYYFSLKCIFTIF